MKIKQITLFVGLISFGFMMSCGGSAEKPTTDTQETETLVEENSTVDIDPMDNVGVGPIKELVLADLNTDMVATGKDIFDSKCSACHKTTKKFIGPNVTGIMERRNPAWVMNMILNPDEMVKEDPIARQLLMDYSAPMANQNLTEDEARSVVEYFRTLKEH